MEQREKAQKEKEEKEKDKDQDKDQDKEKEKEISNMPPSTSSASQVGVNEQYDVIRRSVAGGESASYQFETNIISILEDIRSNQERSIALNEAQIAATAALGARLAELVALQKER